MVKKRKIEQDKRKRIILLLDRKEAMSKGELCKSLNVERPTVDHHLDKLNDCGVVHKTGNGYYSLVDRNVIIKKATSKYLPELQSSLLGLAVISTAVIYSSFYQPSWILPLLVGGLLSLSAPLGFKIYKLLTEEKYTEAYFKLRGSGEKSELSTPEKWD